MKFSNFLVLTQLSALASAGVDNQGNNQLGQDQGQLRANQMMEVNNYHPYPPPPTTTTTTTTTSKVYPPRTTTTTTTTNNVYPPPSTTTTPPLTPDECNKKPALINLCIIAGILKPNPTVCGATSDKTLIDICIVAGILAPTPGACNNRPSAALISICLEAGILPGTRPNPINIDCSKKENIGECIQKGYIKNPTRQQCTLGGVLSLCLSLGLLGL